MTQADLQASYLAVQSHVYSRIADEAVILNMDQGVYYGLNAVGARVWELLQTPQTLPGLCDMIAREYDVAPAQCLSDVQALLADLRAHRLVERREEQPMEK